LLSCLAHHVLCGLRAYPCLLFPQFGGIRRAEIFRFEYLPNFDLRFPLMGIRAAFHPGDRLFLRLDLPQPVAAMSSFVSAKGPSITVR
jgi:hypothetical protein